MKSGKLKIIIKCQLFKPMYISTGVPEYGQSDGPSNAESDRGYAGD